MTEQRKFYMDEEKDRELIFKALIILKKREMGNTTKEELAKSLKLNQFDFESLVSYLDIEGFIMKDVVEGDVDITEKGGAYLEQHKIEVEAIKKIIERGQNENIGNISAMSFIELSDDKIAEQVLDPETKAVKFAIYNKRKEKVDYEEKINLGDRVIIPIESDLVEKGFILFPEVAEYYESEEKLIEEIKEFIHKYLDVKKEDEQILTYSVLFTWLYDRFTTLHYVRALGDYQTGKSRLLDVIGLICYKPMIISGCLTTSPMFRIIEKYRGTLIINEADLKDSSTHNDIIKILNEGFEARGGVIREVVVDKNWDERGFNVYCPKILATREKFRDEATESRCYTIEMEQTEREDIPEILPKEFYDEAQKFRNKLLMFRFKNYRKELPKISLKGFEIEPRLRQVFIPLLSVITDEKTRAKAIELVKRNQKKLIEDRQQTLEYEVLVAVKGLIKDNGKAYVKGITERINQDKKERDKLTSQYVGRRIRDKLNLKTERDREGCYLMNSDKLKARYKRYGINEGQTNITEKLS